MIANDKAMLHQAALAGLGLVYEFPEHIAAPLASGELVTVLDDWQRPSTASTSITRDAS